MTEPGRADASRTRIAGIVLLAVAGVAAVVGLLALGGEGPPSHEAAPTSSPPVALPGLTSSTGPVPGPPPDAVQPGQPGQPGGGGPPVGTPIVPGAGPGGGGDVGGLPPVPGPVPGSAASGLPAVPAGGPAVPGGGNAGGLPPAPGGAPGAPGGVPGTPPGGGSPEGMPTGPGVASGGADTRGLSPTPGPPPVARPMARAPSVVCPAGRPAHRRAAGRRWSPRSSQAPFPVAAARVACRLVPFPLVLPAVRPVPPRSRSACTTTR